MLLETAEEGYDLSAEGDYDDDAALGGPAFAASSVTSELPAAASGPPAPDGKPLFVRLPEFVAVYLVFASDVLVRMGELAEEVYQHYLTELRRVQPDMADAYGHHDAQAREGMAAWR